MRAFEPRPILVSRQMTLIMNLGTGCHYYPFRPKNITVLWLISNYTAW